MKTENLFALFTGVLCLGVLLCSKKNNNQEEVAKDEATVAWIKNLVVTANGDTEIEASETSDLYLHGIEGRDAVREFCQLLIKENFDGSDKDYTLPAECGCTKCDSEVESKYSYLL